MINLQLKFSGFNYKQNNVVIVVDIIYMQWVESTSLQLLEHRGHLVKDAS